MSPIPYTLIRTRRRTLTLQISKEGDLIVRSPLRMGLDTIESFISKKSDWINKHQMRIKSREGSANNKQYTAEEIRKLKKRLQNYIIPRAHALWAGKNLPPITSIKITKSEGRWGSCSAKNGLCFSYRLAEYIESAPLFIDAIIIHELAHFREKNHQKPFWNLVIEWMPHYKNILKNYKTKIED